MPDKKGDEAPQDEAPNEALRARRRHVEPINLGDSVGSFKRSDVEGHSHETPGGVLDCPDCVAYLRGEG